MPTVTARLYGVLRDRIGPPAERVLTVEAGATVRGVLDGLGWAAALATGRAAVALNGEVVRGDAPLSDGDELDLMPPVSGGCA